MKSLDLLQKELNYYFKEVPLLKMALTHRSFSKENNERLEFIGDGILDSVIALNLYKKYPNVTEGQLSQMRASLVNQDTLVELSLQLKLGNFLILGDGEIKSGGRERPSILADCLEAILGAILLDGGFTAVQKVIEALFAPKINHYGALHLKDYKTALQEIIQAHHLNLPNYETVHTVGPEHDMIFTIECQITELNLVSQGNGKGKKQASQEAAFHMIQLLNQVLAS